MTENLGYDGGGPPEYRYCPECEERRPCGCDDAAAADDLRDSMGDR